MSRKEPRLYMDQPLHGGAVLLLEKEQAHYVSHVMRLGMGDALLVFANGQGQWRATLTRADKKGVVLEVGVQTRPSQDRPFLGLAFTPLRPHCLSFLIEKATELGVSDLYPLLTRYTSVRHVNGERLHRIAVEAAEQCERLDVPTLHPLQEVGLFLSQLPEERTVFLCDEHREGALLWNHVIQNPGQPILMVGPEGGFEEQELHHIKNHPKVISVSLGPQILRAETAALAGLALFHACAI